MHCVPYIQLTRCVAALGMSFSLGVESSAAEPCPLIRPAGLSPAQVDQVVLSKLAETLTLDSTKIDRAQTIKVLDRSENMLLHYAGFVVSVGETLGFDSAAAFYARAKQKGSGQPTEVLSIEEYLTLSRQAYGGEKDQSPPQAAEGTSYELHQVIVRPPAPPNGWLILRCMSDQILFQRRSDSAGTSTAVARILSLPPFRSEVDFTAYTRSVATTMLSQLGTIQSLEVTGTSRSSRPCSEFRAAVATHSSPYFVRACFCYGEGQSQLGYAAMFSFAGAVSVEQSFSEATAFIDGVLPK